MKSRHYIFERLQRSLFFTVFVVVFALFVFITVWGKDGLIDLMALHQKKQKILNANHALLKENLLYLEEIEHLKQSRYVEQKARSDMGLIREDEIVFVEE